jgi:TPR repeat protein
VLNDGTADNNGDGYITFSELSGYIQVAASLYNQTPGTDSLAGHEQGDFLFVNPAYQSNAGTSANRDPAGSALMSSATTDVYKPLGAGKRAFVSGDYLEARRMFLQAAELGNAEAMAYLGKLFWEGWGGPKDLMAGNEWLRKAAERGHVPSMQSLENLYTAQGPMQNLGEASRWATARKEAERLEASLTFVEPRGQAGRGEPAIPPDATVVRSPAPPMGLMIQ